METFLREVTQEDLDVIQQTNNLTKRTILFLETTMMSYQCHVHLSISLTLNHHLSNKMLKRISMETTSNQNDKTIIPSSYH